MAFDHEDTDAVFDRLIEATLAKDFGIDVRRVDRINHNDDIDERIIREIEECDICVVDLTYARPSVYFEAGWAQGRKVPVIYTCRVDHLGNTQDNLKVHFDLKMRNIVAWTGADDEGFRRRFKDRVRLLTEPLKQDREQKASVKEQRDAFARLALNRKQERCLAAFEEGAVTAELVPAGSGGFQYYGGMVQQRYEYKLSVFEQQVVVAATNETPAQHKHTIDRMIQQLLENADDPEKLYLSQVFVLANGKRNTKATLGKIFPDFHQHPEGKRFYRTVRRFQGKPTTHFVEIIVLDDVQSPAELQQEVQSLMVDRRREMVEGGGSARSISGSTKN